MKLTIAAMSHDCPFRYSRDQALRLAPTHGGMVEMLLSDALEAFLLSCNGSTSPATLIWYKRRLGALVEFLGDMEVERVTLHDLRRWRVSLCERTSKYVDHPLRPEEDGGLSAYTLHGYVRACRHFFKRLTDEQVLTANPAARLELPRLPKGVVRGIAQADLEKIIAAAAAASPRDHALAWFLYSTACRVGGVVGLRLADLDLDHSRAYVCEKGDKTRPVYLISPAVEAMHKWLEVRPNLADDHVFLGRQGPLKESGVYQVIKRRAADAGVEKGYHPHNWRHRRLRELQARGMPLGVMSQIAGHEGPEVTAKVYGWLSEDELQKLYMQYALPLSVEDK
jgi:integrase/recombinase XerD